VEVSTYWLLIALETGGISFQTTATDRKLSILAHRNLAYKLMHKVLVDNDASNSDNFLLGLSVATSVEQTLGNLRAAQFHCQAIKKILRRRGGLETLRDISYPTGLMVLTSLVGLGLPGLYADQDIRPKVKGLRSKLSKMQTWNQSLWGVKSTQSIRFHANEAQAEGFTDIGLRKRIDAFSERPLFEYVGIPPRVLSEAEYRFLLPILFTINTTLWAFRANQRMTHNYLDLLCDSARLSGTTDFITQCIGGRLPSLVLLIMLGHSAQSSESVKDSSGNEVYAVEEILEFVELMMMASQVTRDLILEVMWSWLTAVEDGDLCCLNKSTLDTLEEEIEAQWVRIENT
jgi:hypothetical protein